MKKAIILSAGAILAISGLTTFSTLSKTESSLTSKANEILSEKGDHFSAVKVEFSGQEATLTGTVASQTDKTAAEKLIRENIRIPAGLASNLNPVTAVDNQLKIVTPAEIQPPAKITPPEEPEILAEALTKPEKTEETQEQTQPTPPAITPRAYAGWTSAPGQIDLFGKVPTAEIKSDIVTSATATFPTSYKINATKLLIAPAFPAAENAEVDFGTIPDLSTPHISFAPYGKPMKLYPYAAYDSEIAADFPALELPEGELSIPLTEFRASLIKSGLIETEQPYLSLIGNGKNLILIGEVASQEEKQTILSAITTANPNFEIIDKLNITPLVQSSPELTQTLSSIPTFNESQAKIAIAKPGSTWRESIVHAIYFATGSDRSKDQERALYQIRRLLKILPSASFEIVGNTDNVGSETSNTKLSLERAESFATYLQNAGIPAEKITTRGAGPTEPIADNSTPAGQALNRRVDVALK